MKKIEAIVFDLYGTLYDVYSVARACGEISPGRGHEIVRLWRRKQLEYTWQRSLMGRYVNFEIVTRDALRFTCAALGVPFDARIEQRLCDEYLRLNPYPEMPAAMRRLRNAGLPLGILSNGSINSLAHVIAHSNMEWGFDQLISVEEVQVFKPHPHVYQLAEQRMGHARENILFVSSNGWGASAAGLFGFPVCWINRGDGPFEELGATPDKVVRDVAAMADWLLARRADEATPPAP